MSPFWWGLLIGTLALGGPVGFLTAALCAAAKAQAAAIEYHYKTSDPAAQDALFEAERTLNRGAWS